MLSPPWVKGQSGNPKGRPRGAQHKLGADALKAIRRLRYNPLIKLIEISNDPSAPLGLRIRCIEAMLPYTCFRAEGMELVERVAAVEARLDENRKA